MIEAIASGLPVISFNTKGANELVIHNKNGILIDDFDPYKMAEIIISKIEEKYFYKKINYNQIQKFDLKYNTKLTQDNY